jgi:hypothetical protein
MQVAPAAGCTTDPVISCNVHAAMTCDGALNPPCSPKKTAGIRDAVCVFSSTQLDLTAQHNFDCAQSRYHTPEAVQQQPINTTQLAQ